MLYVSARFVRVRRTEHGMEHQVPQSEENSPLPFGRPGPLSALSDELSDDSEPAALSGLSGSP